MEKEKKKKKKKKKNDANTEAKGAAPQRLGQSLCILNPSSCLLT